MKKEYENIKNLVIKELENNEKRWLKNLKETFKNNNILLNKKPLTKYTVNYLIIIIKDNNYKYDYAINLNNLLKNTILESNDKPIDILIKNINYYNGNSGVIYKNIDGHGEFKLLCYYDRKSNKKEYYLNPNDKEMTNQDYYDKYIKNIKLDFKPGELDESNIKIDNSRRDFDMIFKDIVSDMTNEELENCKEQFINSNVDKKTIELIDKEIEKNKI